MKYLIVDDEINASSLLKRIVERYPGLNAGDEILVFNDSVEAYSCICRERIDLAFLDIEMPGMTGEELAGKISEMSEHHKPYIVFITAFPQYSLFAWNTGAVGYILKPYSPASIYEAIDKYKKLSASDPDPAPEKTRKAVIRCFPDFDMILDGEPVFFKNKKAKELLAFLVHNRGNWVSLDKIIMSLFENLDEMSSKNHLRTILHRLKTTLKQYQLEDLIESKYGGIRINTSLISCDYYEYLNGNRSLFNGEYMGEYPWAKAAEKHMNETFTFV